jgi:hypothetical protein
MADFAKIIREHGGDISETAINAITSAIKTAVGNEYVEKERYKAKLTEIDTLKEQAQTADDKATTAEKWQDKYNSLKADFDKYKGDVQAKETKAAKEKAYREALKDANLNEKGVEKALKYAEWDKIELDEEGKLKDAKSHVKNAREEWAEYVVKNGQRGAETHNPPENGGGGRTYKTKDEIMKIADTVERQKAIADNHELFGF